MARVGRRGQGRGGRESRDVFVFSILFLFLLFCAVGSRDGRTRRRREEGCNRYRFVSSAIDVVVLLAGPPSSLP